MERSSAGRNGNVWIFGRVRGSSFYFWSCEEVDFARGEKELRTVRFSDSAVDRVGSKEQKRRSESCLEFNEKVCLGQF